MDNNSMSPADIAALTNGNAYGAEGCMEWSRNADKQYNLIFRS